MVLQNLDSKTSLLPLVIATGADSAVAVGMLILILDLEAVAVQGRRNQNYPDEARGLDDGTPCIVEFAKYSSALVSLVHCPSSHGSFGCCFQRLEIIQK